MAVPASPPVNWIGAYGRVGIGREQRGVAYPPPAVATHAMEFVGITQRGFSMPDEQIEWKDYRVFTTTHGRETFKRVPAKITRPYNLPFLPVNPKFLYYPTGNYRFLPGVGAIDGKNLHVFELQNHPSLPTFTYGGFFEGTARFQRRFRGCVVNNQGLTISEGNELQCTWGGFGARVLDHDIEEIEDTAVINDPTPTLNTDPEASAPYMFYDTDANIGIAGAYDLQNFEWGFGVQGRHIARVKSVNMSHNNGLKTQHFYSTGAEGGGGIGPQGAREPFFYSAGASQRSISMNIVPTAHMKSLGGDVVYDLLANDVKGDIVIPFRRYTEAGVFIDSIDIVFLGAGISRAPHDRPDDGNEVPVSVEFEAERILFVCENSQPNYGFANE